MTISIDCRTIGASGIGVYIQECLPFFLESNHHFLLIGSAEKIAAASKGLLARSNAQILEYDVKPFSPKELLCFPRRILQKINKSDLYYSPHFNIPAGIKVPIFTTIHDIIFPDMPELTSRLGLAARMWWYKRAFKKSATIFTVSEFSASRIAHYMERSRHKARATRARDNKKIPIVVTHSAIQPHLLQFDCAAVKKQKNIIFVGNIKRHKGLWCLLDAFFAARNEGLEYKLVIVGEKENFRSADKASLKKIADADASALEFSGRLSNEELQRRLCEAALLVQPSLYEGFCLPPLEAMVSGTESLLSDIPVLREIYGGYPVLFFRAGDSEDLKQKLLGLLRGKEPRPLELPPDLRQTYTFSKTQAVIMEHLELVGKNT